ncbi:radical SAM domain protein [Acaryochloris marina MBIC11017]|uniref:Radical SAM domain protein n=2 Tax=Acaryochloris marina TaxID=155978 RepID=B0C5X7_ACAM1|nr:radical SAM domain protein [Acaryochloris marina MBIC11017]
MIQIMSQYSSKLKMPNVHLFRAEEHSMLLSIEQGSIYEIDDIYAEMLDRWMEFGEVERVHQVLSAKGIHLNSVPPEAPPKSIPIHALSLAIAQKCNLGCTYCYAHQGSFGGNEGSMSFEVARNSIDLLLKGTESGETVSLAYLGGEPLANRSVLQKTTEYTIAKASSVGIKTNFSLTTNGTLLTVEDAEFFNNHGFSVTISIDGNQEKHDFLRPFKSGKGSYKTVIEKVKLLLDIPHRRCRVSARVTVTPENLCLEETLDKLVSLGFDNVMFSPVLKSPTGLHQMGEFEFEVLLNQMIECGQKFEQNFEDHKIYPFANILNTLQRIHHYRCDAYPCGAGGAYLGVSSKGDLYACHRFVDDAQGSMGNIVDGVDPAKQENWLAARNVHTQEPCKACWARYLCGGGCHHESIYRGRPACDYIRGWLHYCLGVYVKLLKINPSLLDQILNNQSVSG